MTTVAMVVDRVRRELFGPQRHLLNTLGADMGSTLTDSSMVFTFEPAGVAAGSLLGVEDEIVYVVSADRVAKTAGVMRGQFGTSPSVHTAGVMVEINPRFFRGQILDVLKEEIDSWPTTVYRTRQLVLSATNGQRGFNFNGIHPGWLNILSVERSSVGTAGMIDPASWPRLDSYRVVRPGAAFVDGGIVFDRSFDVGTQLVVTYSMPFDTGTWSETTDLEVAVGVSSTLLDALKYGALWRLTSTLDISRGDPAMNVDTRTEQASQGNPNTTTAMALLRLRDRRLSDEAARLLGMYGMPQT